MVLLLMLFALGFMAVGDAPPTVGTLLLLLVYERECACSCCGLGLVLVDGIARRSDVDCGDCCESWKLAYGLNGDVLPPAGRT